MQEKYVVAQYSTPDGSVPAVLPKMNWADYWGAIKARLNISRMNYKVEPGLYAVNQPTSDSVVLVSANYKMSFDYLRRELQNISAWILVMDTKGINVWCAAGKGTFGTKELIRQLLNTKLSQRVKHREVIVPQLGAPGIAAHEVKKEAGFRVIYGPVQAADLGLFLQQGQKADKTMRRVTFNWLERAVLIPIEVVGHFKYVLYALTYFTFVAGIGQKNFSIHLAWSGALTASLYLFAGLMAGTVLMPLALPFIPGRPFAWKGALLGLTMFGVVQVLVPGALLLPLPEQLAWGLVTVAIASFTAMNFTGTSTYTSLSGVLKEMKVALPLQIIAFASGVILWTVLHFL